MNIEASFIPYICSMKSILSRNDRNFIEFTRCLYKAKSVVQELSDFSKTIGPTLCLSPNAQKQIHDPRIATDEFIIHAKQYLEDSFKKLNHMCKVLLLVLKKLETNRSVKKERVDSFRQDILSEWQKAISIKQDLLLLVQANSSSSASYPDQTKQEPT